MSIPLNPRTLAFQLLFFISYSVLLVTSRTLPSISIPNDPHSNSNSQVFIWPLPSNFTFGNQTLSINPDLSLAVSGNGGNSGFLADAFDRYRRIIFKHESKLRRNVNVAYDIEKISVVVHSDDQEVGLLNLDVF